MVNNNNTILCNVQRYALVVAAYTACNDLSSRRSPGFVEATSRLTYALAGL